MLPLTAERRRTAMLIRRYCDAGCTDKTQERVGFKIRTTKHNTWANNLIQSGIWTRATWAWYQDRHWTFRLMLQQLLLEKKTIKLLLFVKRGELPQELCQPQGWARTWAGREKGSKTRKVACEVMFRQCHVMSWDNVMSCDVVMSWCWDNVMLPLTAARRRAATLTTAQRRTAILWCWMHRQNPSERIDFKIRTTKHNTWANNLIHVNSIVERAERISGL